MTDTKAEIELPFDAERLSSKAASMFGMIDTEQMWRTIKALRELNMSYAENTRTATPAPAEREEALATMPICDWFDEEWNKWIAEHHPAIEAALSGPSTGGGEVDGCVRCNGTGFYQTVDFTVGRPEIEKCHCNPPDDLEVLDLIEQSFIERNKGTAWPNLFKRIRQRLYATQPPTGEPAKDGWKLVPIEPTEEMKLKAASFYRNFGATSGSIIYDIYRVMLAAAPDDKGA